jgi:hypothetical protein
MTFRLVLVAILLPITAWGQTSKSEQILAFATPWSKPTDYAWERESVSQVEGESQPALKIKDKGRIRVEFVKFENESALLNFTVLQLMFETRVKKEPPLQGVSPLVGKHLPTTWLHWAMGYSMDLVPGAEQPKPVQGQQASQVFELLDFRGFIPSEIPKVNSEWNLKVVPDRGKEYLVTEELERHFKCLELIPQQSAFRSGEGNAINGGKSDQVRCKLKVTELNKITPTEKSGNWELSEREGTVWLYLPKGIIDSAQWVTQSTESVKTKLGTSTIKTETKVSLAMIAIPFTSPTKPPREKESEWILPPR